MTDKIKEYSRIKYALAISEIIYMLLLLFFFQFSGLAAWLKVNFSQLFINQVVLIFFYTLFVFWLYVVFDFPLDFIRSYIVEHRFGLSEEKLNSWLSDHIKASLISFIIFIISVEGFFYFLRNQPANWWWLASFFWIFLSIVLARIFPILIIPLFFKYKKIENETLRSRILGLANKMKIKILDVYQIDFSKKSTKANAGLVGLGKSKRVILTDTLEGKFAPQEIEVILAHEFAHLKLRHMIKLIILNATAVLVVFYILSGLSPLIFGRFKLALDDVAGIGIWIFCFVVFQILFAPLLNWICRNMERNADRQAIKFTEQKDAFISMLEKLCQQNFVERKPHFLVKIFFYDHPPLEERIALAQKGI